MASRRHMGINMKNLRITAISVATLLSSLTLMGGAQAQSTWNVYNGSSGGSGCSQKTGTGSNSGNYNNSWNCTSATASGNTQAGASMTASAWSTDRGTNVWTRGTPFTQSYERKEQATKPSGSGWVSQALTNGSGTTFASAYMSSQGNSGFGAASRTEGLGATPPNHAFDSVNPGTTDMMLLDFGAVSVVLDKIGIGWKGSDADITVMRWTGDQTNPPDRIDGTTAVGGKQNLEGTLATSTLAGWELVGSFADLGTDSDKSVQTGNGRFGDAAISTGADPTKGSSWWLISTYNTTFDTTGKCKDSKGKACSVGDDSFKLNFIATLLPTKTPPNEVPEPGSLALAGVALAGVLGARRRSSKQR